MGPEKRILKAVPGVEEGTEATNTQTKPEEGANTTQAPVINQVEQELRDAVAAFENGME